jgi:hypothetical protein
MIMVRTTLHPDRQRDKSFRPMSLIQRSGGTVDVRNLSAL